VIVDDFENKNGKFMDPVRFAQIASESSTVTF
jgi:hypothetical protein